MARALVGELEDFVVVLEVLPEVVEVARPFFTGDGVKTCRIGSLREGPGVRDPLLLIADAEFSLSKMFDEFSPSTTFLVDKEADLKLFLSRPKVATVARVMMAFVILSKKFNKPFL